MRSLMALLMLSAAWAYLSDLKFWKKCVLFLSAIPLAVIGNGVRITSIVVLAGIRGPRVCRENLARLVRPAVLLPHLPSRPGGRPLPAGRGADLEAVPAQKAGR